MLPNLIVIGAMKCATTSLHHYLDRHPDVSMVAEKELHFFVAERNWSKGLAWYERQFVGESSIHGESSTTYTRFPQYAGVAARMHGVVPEARLIYIVRDPVERIVSHYVHECAAGREDRTLPAALAQTGPNPYLDLSRYGTQLEQYLLYYPRERILILSAEALSASPVGTLSSVYRFLGVRESVSLPRFRTRRHRSRNKRRLGALGSRLAKLVTACWPHSLPPRVRRAAWRLLSFPFSSPVERPALDDALRSRLAAELRPDVDRFRALAGDPFSAWSI